MIAAAILPLLAMASPQPGLRIVENMVREMPRRATVHFELFVTPDREVVDCRIKESQPTGILDESDCHRLIGKKVEKPALGPDGQPAYGLFGFVLSTGDPPRSAVTPSDFVVEVADLPGDSSEARVNLILFIDVAGTATHCQQVGPGEENLARVACQQAGSHRWTLRSDRNGAPVGYSAAVGVDFVEKS